MADTAASWPTLADYAHRVLDWLPAVDAHIAGKPLPAPNLTPRVVEASLPMGGGVVTVEVYFAEWRDALAFAAEARKRIVPEGEAPPAENPPRE